jgi:hypothetical protein
MKLYAIFDRAVAAYMQPFPAHSNAHAIRLFSDHANENNSPVNKHPEDYSLDYLTDFNEADGTMNGTPNRIAKANDYVIKTEPPTALDISEALARRNAK